MIAWALAQWNALPVGTRAYLVSLSMSITTVASTAVGIGWSLGPTNGGFNNWPTFEMFVANAWFGMVIGIVFQIGPYARAVVANKQAPP